MTYLEYVIAAYATFAIVLLLLVVGFADLEAVGRTDNDRTAQ